MKRVKRKCRKVKKILQLLSLNFTSIFYISVEVAPSRGRRRSKGVPVGTQTKHDADVCGRKNVRNMEKVAPISG